MIRSRCWRVRAVVAACFVFSFCARNDLRATTPSIDPGFIVFGYVQSESILPGVRWNALTHVGGNQITFTSAGHLNSSISSRSSLLKTGGPAEAAGVKYVPVITSFDDAAGGVIETVMTDYTTGGPKDTLISEIITQVTGDSYCAGVDFDIEFSWGSTVRDGIADMLTKLRSRLPAQYEISVYVNAIYRSSQWNAANLAATCNYVLFSGYDWATGNTPHAITDHNSDEPNINAWISAGITPEKFVYVISSYGRRWTGTTQYDVTGTGKASTGFPEGLFDTTLRNTNGGPFLYRYQRGDEAAWHTYTVGSTNYTVTWDSEEALEYKLRSTTSFTSGANAGRRLGGVGYWSLLWMQVGYSSLTTAANAKSTDPITGTVAYGLDYMRTYPHVYQLSQEILSPPGTVRQVFDKFEYLEPHWDGFTNADAANRQSPDNIGVNTSSARSIQNARAGGGKPPNTTRAMEVSFSFSSNPAKMFFRHELLGDDTSPAVIDTHAADAKFSRYNAINAYVWVGGSGYPGDTVRLAVVDGSRQLEASPQYSLATPGWNLFTWDLADSTPGNINGLTTAEPALLSGNSVINGNGPRDIGFMGFIVERSGSGAASGTLQFDELSYEPRTPNGANYKINEFRYNGSAGEFVEIKGPAGPFPTSLQLRFYNSADGSVLSSVPLGGNSVLWNGLFVLGDPGVANVSLTPSGWSDSANNIPDTAPSAMQLFDTSNNCVYDSVTYRAMGGLFGLSRKQTNGVTAKGYGWLGETGTGTNSAGDGPAFGRYPDGADSFVNENDFSLMWSTPGAANGGAILPGGATFFFDSTPGRPFQTYGAPVASPLAAGMPASPNGGNALRVVNNAGGGTEAYFGDAALGSGVLGYSNGYVVSGQMYIPGGGEQAQALGVGFCARQGSTFFDSAPAGSGYESGYWLIYEQGAVGLNDGQPSHSQQFQFVMARNDNMSSNRTTALGSNMTLPMIGITDLPANGTWVTFRLRVDPTNIDINKRLIAQVNGADVYRGQIPSGGYTSGPVQLGYRLGSGGTVAANTGLWIDNLVISPIAGSGVDDWEKY